MQPNRKPGKNPKVPEPNGATVKQQNLNVVFNKDMKLSTLNTNAKKSRNRMKAAKKK
jgi:outer membrane protein assembly factor BamE (lipoprotein component of BamABCDE complex)